MISVEMAERIAICAIQCIVALVLAPILVGITRQVRARMEGRVGAGVVQPLRDIAKLLHKERIRSEHSSWTFIAAPWVILVSTIAVVAVVPFVVLNGALNSTADVYAVVFLLLCGTMMLALAGLDSGTAFGGMGSSREMTIAALSEPTLLLALLALASRTRETDFAGIVNASLDTTHVQPELFLVMIAMAIITMAENGRIPVDNPSTHLELTMVHEAMTLEYSGRDLAMIELGSHLRLFVFLTLFANLFFPFGIAANLHPGSLLVALAAITAKLSVLAAIVGGVEVFLAKLRLFRIPEMLTGSFVLSFLAVTLTMFFS